MGGSSVGVGEVNRLRRVFIGLGSNLGDREANLKAALRWMHRKGITVVRVSSLYETEPIGVSEPQPPYLNAVVEVKTGLPLTELLDLLEAIERRLGRTEKGGGQPRSIDLDILWADGEKVQSERLTVPHPRLWERAFVLLPLADLISKLDGVSLPEAAVRLAQGQKVRLVRQNWWQG